MTNKLTKEEYNAILDIILRLAIECEMCSHEAILVMTLETTERLQKAKEEAIKEFKQSLNN